MSRKIQDELYLNRRSVLKLGAGLALLLSPIVRARRAEAASDSTMPRRLVIIRTPNGVHGPTFWPFGGHGSQLVLAADGVLGPLAAFRDQLMVVKGLHLDTAQFSLGHFAAVGQLLTNQPVGESLDPKGTNHFRYPQGPSIDQFIAANAAEKTRVQSLQLGHFLPEFAGMLGHMSYPQANQWCEVETDMRQAHARLFEGFIDQPAADAQRERASQLGILDCVAGDLRRLRQELTGEERAKLDRHLGAVEEMLGRLDDAERDAGKTCSVPERDQFSVEAVPTLNSAHLTAQTELVAAAFACDLTRIVTMMWCAEGEYGVEWQELGEKMNHHTASHLTIKEYGEAHSIAALTKIGRMFAGRIAHFLGKLAAIPEGAGTVLDHTTVVWTSPLGAGDTHEFTDIPFVIAGGGGGFKMGRKLDFKNQRNHSGLLIALAHAMGQPIARFGDTTTSAEGPLPDLT